MEVADDLMEQLVKEGKAERSGHATSYKLMWQRVGMRRVAIDKVKYRTAGADGETSVESAQMPEELIWRCLVTASLLAHIIVNKRSTSAPRHSKSASSRLAARQW